MLVFGTVGWISGKLSSHQKMSDEVLVWLSVYTDVQLIYVWSS